MKKGVIDATASQPPSPMRLQQEGYRIIAGPSDLKLGSPAMGVAVTHKRLHENPDELRRVLRSILRGMRFKSDQRADSVDIMTRWLGQSRDAAEASYAAIVAAMSPDGSKGFTGRQNLFEGPYGFTQFLGEDAPLESLVDNFGKPWGLEDPGIDLKRYSCQRHTHRTIEAILTLFREKPWRPEDIESLDVATQTLPTVVPYNHYTAKNNNPTSSIESRFSLRYIAAVTALTGKLDVDSFSDAKRLSGPLVELLEKVTVHMLPEKGQTVTVTLRLRDGTNRHLEVYRSSSLPAADAPQKFSQLRATRDNRRSGLFRDGYRE